MTPGHFGISVLHGAHLGFDPESSRESAYDFSFPEKLRGTTDGPPEPVMCIDFVAFDFPKVLVHSKLCMLNCYQLFIVALHCLP